MNPEYIYEFTISPNYRSLDDISDEQLRSFLTVLPRIFPGGIVCYDTSNFDLLFLSQGAADLFGFSHIKLSPGGTYSLPVSTPADAVRELLYEGKKQIDTVGQLHLNIAVSSNTGETIHIRLDGGLAENAEWGSYLICILSDVTGPLREFSNLHNCVDRDELTGLYVRSAVECQCGRYLQWVGNYKNHAIFRIELDNFRAVVGALGEDTANEILKTTGALLTGAFRADDLLGRLGDHEFFVLMKNVPDQRIVKNRASEICHMVSRLFMEYEYPPGSCSIGITYGRLDALSLKENMDNADLSLFRAKERGKNNWSICEYDYLSNTSRESCFGSAGRCSNLEE